MLRIAVDARPLAHPHTGIGRYTEALLSRLVKTGHQWLLYSDRPITLRFPIDERVQLRMGKGVPGSPLSLFFTQLVFPRWAQGDCVDLFWSPRHHLPLRIPGSIPTVVTVHDLVWKRYPQTMLLRNRLLEQLLMSPSLRSASGIIAVSAFTASEVAAVLPECRDRCVEIAEACERIDYDYELACPVPTSPYFLFVGTPEPRKNLQGLLEGFARACDQGLQHQLVVVGSGGWGGQDLKSMIAALNLEGRVVCRGQVSDAELSYLYRSSVGLVMPSFYEGFGLPVLEAMQHGVPVIVSRRGALPEVAGGGGVLVDPGSPEELAAAMLSLANDAELHQRLSVAAKHQAASFSWDKAAQQTLSFFMQVQANARR